MVAPQVVSENHDPRRVGAVILIGECSAQLRVHAMRFKKAAGDGKPRDVHSPIRVAGDRRVEAVSRHVLETPAALAPVVKASGADVSEVRLDARLIMYAALVAAFDVHQAVGVFV